MKFRITRYVLYCSLLFLSPPPRAYPLSLEYMLPPVIDFIRKQ